MFATEDIVLFHVQLRSFFDHAAAVIAALSPKPAQVPDDSFRRLRERHSKLGSRLPRGLRELIETADWFDLVRDVRDALIHRTAETAILARKPLIAFQVFEATRPAIQIPEVMIGERVVDFERYAAWLGARVYDFADRLGREVYASRRPGEAIHRTRIYHPGVEVLGRWIQELGMRVTGG